MTDLAWSQGMALMLAAGLPGWPSDAKEATARAAVLRQLVDHLDDAAWLHAAKFCAARERWFPVPAALLEAAESYVPPMKALPPARTEGEREEGRRSLTEGLKLLRAAVPSLPPGSPLKSWPRGTIDRPVVVASDERLDELRRQAARICDGPETATGQPAEDEEGEEHPARASAERRS